MRKVKFLELTHDEVQQLIKEQEELIQQLDAYMQQVPNYEAAQRANIAVDILEKLRKL